MCLNFWLVGIPVGIGRSVVALKTYAIATRIKKHNSIIKKKRRKK